MIYIFVDVDGVLNCSTSKGWQSHYHTIDKDKVGRLNEVILACKPECHVILSSTWRHSEDAKHALRGAGVSWNAETECRMSYLERDVEIRRHMEVNQIPIDNVIIFDDACNKTIWGNALIHTDFYNGGLSEEKKNEALARVRYILHGL